MRLFRSRTGALMRKEFIQMVRDPRTFLTVLASPLMMLFIFGYGLSADIKEVRLGVVDWSHTQQSRDLHNAFTSSAYFKDAFATDKYEELGHALDDRRIQIGLVIPADFARDVEAGRATAVQVILDGSDPNTATTISGYASSIIQTYSSSVLTSVLQRHGIQTPSTSAPPIDVRPRVWFNEDLLSIYFIVPGVIAMILMMTTATLTASTITRERERGSIEQIVASPVTATELMFGKTGAYVVLACVQVVLVVLLGHFLFGVPIKGSLLVFGVCSLFFITSSLGIGLLASSRAKTQRAAQTIVGLLTMIPSMILSGFIFPIASMPPVVQIFTYVIPARYYMVIVRGVFLKGENFVDLWPQIWPLIALSVLLMGGSILTFKKRL